MGGEIGNHSYTHLINPPTDDLSPIPRSADTPAGSTTDHAVSVPSFAGSRSA